MNFHDDLLDEDRLRVQVDRFFPSGRLGGPNYCSTGEHGDPVPTWLPSAGKARE